MSRVEVINIVVGFGGVALVGLAAFLYFAYTDRRDKRAESKRSASR